MSDKLKAVDSTQPSSRPKCPHRQGGEVKPVNIGDHTIWVGGGMYLTEEDKSGFELLIDLRKERLPKGIKFGQQVDNVLYLPIRDYAEVAEEDVREFGKRMMHLRRRIAAGERVLIFCAGGHGRTGLVLCYALLQFEPTITDPVAEIRRRYCPKAVETDGQQAQIKRWQSGAQLAYQAMNS